MPFMGNLEQRSVFDNRLSRRLLPSFIRLLCNQSSPEHTRSSLKLRLLTAIAQLADDLDININELGYLFDRTLETGTHIDLAEFLLLSENASTEYRGVQLQALKRTTADTNSGVMLFFVRELPQRERSGSTSSSSTAFNAFNGSMESSWPQKYAEKGYRLKFMRRFRDTLADATGAAQRDVDRILLGCRDYVSNGTKSVLEPGGTYISLYSERSSASGSREVLVYDFAKHQVRICPPCNACLLNIGRTLVRFRFRPTALTSRTSPRRCKHGSRTPQASRHSSLFACARRTWTAFGKRSDIRASCSMSTIFKKKSWSDSRKRWRLRSSNFCRRCLS